MIGSGRAAMIPFGGAHDFTNACDRSVRTRRENDSVLAHFADLVKIRGGRENEENRDDRGPAILVRLRRGEGEQEHQLNAQRLRL